MIMNHPTTSPVPARRHSADGSRERLIIFPEIKKSDHNNLSWPDEGGTLKVWKVDGSEGKRFYCLLTPLDKDHRGPERQANIHECHQIGQMSAIAS